MEIIKYFLNCNSLLICLLKHAHNYGKGPVHMSSEMPILPWIIVAMEANIVKKHIAANSNFSPRPLCNPKICVSCPDGKSHMKSAQKRPFKGRDFNVDRFSTNELHSYPEPLTNAISEHCQDVIWEIL